jgi:ribosomal-protein-alanine N-acetyltransferase
MFAMELAKPSTIRIAARMKAAGDRLKPVPGESRLVGYLICSQYADVWHLMNVAVGPGFRRRGIGSGMVRDLVGGLGRGARVTLEVRESNRGAIAMYESLGFRAAGTRPGYYPDNGESAVIMWLNPPRGEWSP